MLHHTRSAVIHPLSLHDALPIFLTGTVPAGSTFAQDEIRSRIPRFQGDNLAANQALVDHVRALADARGATAGQVALAWLRSEEHTSELQSRRDLVCRLLLEEKKT